MLLQNLRNKKIILGSRSPRRQFLLQGLELDFEIRPSDAEEVFPDQLGQEEVAIYLSELKAKELLPELADDELLITADTVVFLGDAMLEKPQDENDARRMLSLLSGNTHHVITGVSITTTNRQISFSDLTKVTFASLEDSEIDYYIRQYKPFDKAGSYGAQELIGYIGIDELQGSYFNVMGLPVHKLYRYLKSF